MKSFIPLKRHIAYFYDSIDVLSEHLEKNKILLKSLLLSEEKLNVLNVRQNITQYWFVIIDIFIVCTIFIKLKSISTIKLLSRYEFTNLCTQSTSNRELDFPLC